MPLLRNDALIGNPIIRRQLTDILGSRFVQELNKQRAAASALSGGIESVDALPSLPDTSYPEGAVVFLTTDEKLYRNTDGSTWSKAVDGADVTANTLLANAITSGTISSAEIVIGSGGEIRQGQTDYDTGTGFWLGDDGGTPKFSIGDSTADKLTWNGSTLELTGELEINQVVEFTPTWTGFSSDPSGNCVLIDCFSVIFIWPAIYADSFSGTSNATSFVMTGLPSISLPTTAVSSCLGIAFDSDGNELAQATLIFSSGWQVRFDAQTLSGSNKIQFSSSGWANSGSKGWQGVLMFAGQKDAKS